MLDISALLIILLALGAIIFILYRKMPLLSQVDIDEVEKEKKKKYYLIEQRLKRKISRLTEKMEEMHIVEKFKNIRGSLIKFSSAIKRKKNIYLAQRKTNKLSKKSHDQRTSKNETINSLDEVKKLIKEEKIQEAEELVIGLIKDNPKQIDAYKLLAEVYIIKKNWVHAEATLEHVTRLAERLKNVRASDFLDLAEVKMKLEKAEDGLMHMKKAVSLEPSNPKILHFMVKMCILTHQKDLAWKYYRKLKETNKDNNGLGGLLEELKKLND